MAANHDDTENADLEPGCRLGLALCDWWVSQLANNKQFPVWGLRFRENPFFLVFLPAYIALAHVCYHNSLPVLKN